MSATNDFVAQIARIPLSTEYLGSDRIGALDELIKVARKLYDRKPFAIAVKPIFSAWSKFTN